MKKQTRYIVQSAIIAAMYAALCHLQNIILPNSASWPIQFRVAEALCVLPLFSTAAIPGLTIGCFVFNITYPGAMPLDIVIGPIASLLAALAMYWLRKYPWVSFALPAVSNALLVGWELSVYIGGGFWLHGRQRHLFRRVSGTRYLGRFLSGRQ